MLYYLKETYLLLLLPSKIKMGPVNPVSGKQLCTDGVLRDDQSRSHAFQLNIILELKTKVTYFAFKSSYFHVRTVCKFTREESKYVWQALK
jgi:hypothetical protein